MKKVEKKCDLCGKMIFVDEWGNGKCRVCGWKNNNDCLKYPDATNPPNFVSLNKAKELFKSKKQLLPTYDEILELIKRGLDLSFVYNINLIFIKFSHYGKLEQKTILNIELLMNSLKT